MCSSTYNWSLESCVCKLCAHSPHSNDSFKLLVWTREPQIEAQMISCNLVDLAKRTVFGLASLFTVWSMAIEFELQSLSWSRSKWRFVWCGRCSCGKNLISATTQHLNVNNRLNLMQVVGDRSLPKPPYIQFNKINFMRHERRPTDTPITHRTWKAK